MKVCRLRAAWNDTAAEGRNAVWHRFAERRRTYNRKQNGQSERGCPSLFTCGGCSGADHLMHYCGAGAWAAPLPGAAARPGRPGACSSCSRCMSCWAVGRCSGLTDMHWEMRSATSCKGRSQQEEVLNSVEGRLGIAGFLMRGAFAQRITQHALTRPALGVSPLRAAGMAAACLGAGRGGVTAGPARQADAQAPRAGRCKAPVCPPRATP